MNHKLILTADDFGVYDEIDNAIISAIQQKRLTAVSVIVTFQGWEQRVEKLLELRQSYDFGIGLHFCITAGKPLVAPPNSPLRHEIQADYFQLVQNYNFKGINKQDIAEELEAQILALKNVLKDEPIDHLNNHHNIVYAIPEFFDGFLEMAHKYMTPIRSPMSWYRKFKGIQQLPDYEGGELLSPTMKRGIKIGMWRKLAQQSYGNLLIRMHKANKLSVRYSDVLCEYVYGQTHPTNNKGKSVITHALYQFIDQGMRKSLVDSKENKDPIPVDYTGIHYANENTIEKAKKGRRQKFPDVIRDYGEKRYTKEFSMELIFHLAEPSADYTKMPEMHGMRLDFVPYRQGEFKALTDLNLEYYIDLMQLQLIPYQRL
ncbi:ChbG/HpnK family deacetylase [Paracrocinitomix mangrovi]|uniref:ChbG/HpnK family deacetylase n=1 Tax=Paracrocinitomix mangrovi TaxID=2862509 RepID=UPI001C8D2ED4|nr:ChbG/HpnK family deacetylase [Paracrocinitomix mangrovi]UKN00714.1 ChbG/HpnK family deacetylase [Paracrocinitomix mangrovi]